MKLAILLQKDKTMNAYFRTGSSIYRVSFLTGPAQKSFKYGTGPTQQQKLTKYTGPTQGPNVGKVFYKEFLSLKKYRFLLQEKMSSLEPWEDRPQTLFDLYLKLDWLALGGTSVLG